MEIDVALLRIAEGNDGIISRRQAVEMGCPERSIDRRVAAGFLARVFPGVYRLSSHPDTPRARALAAWLWGGEGALVGGGTALALAGIEGFESGPVDIYISNGKSIPGIRTRRLPSHRMTRRALAGVMATSIEQALLDACAHHPVAKVGHAMDEALRRKLTTVERLRAAIPTQTRGVRGAKNYTRLVRGRDLNDQEVRSEMETRMLKILRKIKDHNFVPNFEITAKRRYFLDFAFPTALLGIECQSRRHHAANRVTYDNARHRDLLKLGWVVLYYTWDDIVFRPREVQQEIEWFLARASGMFVTSQPDQRP